MQAALANLMQGRTVFVIAHRLSTVRRATRIAVIEGGQITEIGTHEELMQHSGTYRRLYNMQFGDEGVGVPAGSGEIALTARSGGDCVSEIYSMTGYASLRGARAETAWALR